MEGISFCPAGHSEMLKSAKGWQEGDLVPPGSSKSPFEAAIWFFASISPSLRQGRCFFAHLHGGKLSFESVENTEIWIVNSPAQAWWL